tara:strand:- start:5826 stop:6041 length:216 start_codon:yes stop_codon:yes gene_type:complete
MNNWKNINGLTPHDTIANFAVKLHVRLPRYLFLIGNNRFHTVQNILFWNFALICKLKIFNLGAVDKILNVN